ncbi:MAG: hypothetical protein DRN15_01465 [Thermoprotei archaeon]|nr:MAG: hypothetical protein DRN15_01465 [Thermoprotei archaeon]RLF25863.1 MAG: hypothetical protein DRM97_00360 [Thermoprotei archaeon]
MTVRVFSSIAELKSFLENAEKQHEEALKKLEEIEQEVRQLVEQEVYERIPEERRVLDLVYAKIEIVYSMPASKLLELILSLKRGVERSLDGIRRSKRVVEGLEAKYGRVIGVILTRFDEEWNLQEIRIVPTI